MLAFEVVSSNLTLCIYGSGARYRGCGWWSMRGIRKVGNSRIVYRRERKPGTKWYVVEVLREILLPLVVLAVGVFCSVAALTTL